MEKDYITECGICKDWKESSSENQNKKNLFYTPSPGEKGLLFFGRQINSRHLSDLRS